MNGSPTLFDDEKLDRHIRSLTKLAPPWRRQSEKRAMGVHYGTCRYWNAEGRFGFIAPDEPIVEVADRDLYVGWKALAKTGLKSLQRADRVSFDIGRGKDGRPEAINVQLLEAEAAMAA